MNKLSKVTAPFLACLTATGLLCALPNGVQAQTYPTHPVRIAVPFAAGGIADITTRIVAEKLGSKLGQSFFVDNQPGPGGIAAARSAITQGSDGYSLALFTNGTAISVGLFKNLRYDPVKDFAPVSAFGAFDFLFVTSGESRFKSMADFLREAKAKPGELTIGTVAAGSTQNLSAELFKTTAGIDVRIVPYRATPELSLAVIRGDVDLLIDSYASLRANFQDGKLRPLATSSIKRSKNLPDLPTADESGVTGFDVTSWNALFAPKGTPKAVTDLLNATIVQSISDPATTKLMFDLGIEAVASTPDELEARLVGDIARWGKVIDQAGIEKQ